MTPDPMTGSAPSRTTPRQPARRYDDAVVPFTAPQLAPAQTDPGTDRPAGFDITAAPRAVLRESIRLLYSLLGEERLGTAQANAWAGVCADRERARRRAEVARVISAARMNRLP